MPKHKSRNNFVSRNNFRLILFVISLILVNGSLIPAMPHLAAGQADLTHLPITFPAQSPDVVAYFNSIARPDDIVSVPYQYSRLLPLITAGQKMIGYASWEMAEKELPQIASEIEWVIYNPEHWQNTPLDEQQNLPEIVKKASEYLHKRNLRFMLAPDRKFAEASLAAIAPYPDAILLQGQRIQDQPAVFETWIKAKIEIARQANPQIKIYVQVAATRGDVDQMLTAIETVASQIDGVAVWSGPPTLNELKRFISRLRQQTSQTATTLSTPAASFTASPSTATLTSTVEVTETEQARISPTSPAPSQAPDTPSIPPSPILEVPAKDTTAWTPGNVLIAGILLALVLAIMIAIASLRKK